MGKVASLDKPMKEPADSRKTRAQPPEELSPLHVEEPGSYAGGIPAIVQSMKFALGEAGLLRGSKLLLHVNQTDGFDCPGCAWPDPDSHRSTAEFCENGAKAVAEEGTTKRVTREFFASQTVAELSQRSDYWLGRQGRLTEPMVLRKGATHYQPISWDEAFALVGSELNALASPDEAAFYTSGRTSNEAAFLYQLFARQFGTNNLPDCSNMCHESSGSALSETIGIGKGTVKLEDFDQAQVIVVIGQNPGTNHPRMLTALQSAVRKGAKVVSINPLREAGLLRFKHPQEVLRLLGPGGELTSLFLQVRINGDGALLQGVCKELIELEARKPGSALDRSFIESRTAGYDEFARAMAQVNWDDLVEESGVSREEMRELAGLLAQSQRIIFCWAMGLTQHKNAVDNIQEIVNLLLLRGSIGKPGAGVCPVRGHSNVQGDRTMGVWEKMPPAFLDALGRELKFEPPRKHGYDTVESIQAMQQGKLKVFFAMGGNFLSATPDTEAVAAGLRGLKLTVHVSTKLNRAHLVTGEAALILPCLGRTEHDVRNGKEQFVTVENSMGVVSSSRGRAHPASAHLLSEPEIVARLALATLKKPGVDWAGLVSDYDNIRNLIERVIPGFEKFNERVRHPGGFYLPNGPREGIFKTELAGDRARFTVHPLRKLQLGKGQLLMMTVRSHDQYNTTIYGLADRYRGLSNERRVVLLHAADIAALGLSEGQVVDLTSHFEGETRTARQFIVVPYDIPRRCAATYFPETNVLVPLRSVADKSNTPTSKSIIITLAPSGSSAPFDPDRVEQAQA